MKPFDCMISCSGALPQFCEQWLGRAGGEDGTGKRAPGEEDGALSGTTG